MIASAHSLKRMADRKLRRQGLYPVVRGDAVFLCESQKLQLVLGDFWSIFDYDTEVRIASKEDPITDVLLTKKKRFVDNYAMYQNKLDHDKKEKDYESAQAAGQFEELLHDVNKIQVQVK